MSEGVGSEWKTPGGWYLMGRNWPHQVTNHHILTHKVASEGLMGLPPGVVMLFQKKRVEGSTVGVVRGQNAPPRTGKLWEKKHPEGRHIATERTYKCGKRKRQNCACP